MLYALLQHAMEDHGLDSTCWRLIAIAGGIVAGLVTALGIVWSKFLDKEKELSEIQKERLQDEERHRNTMRELLERLISRGKK
jgi:hypothetical protein